VDKIELVKQALNKALNKLINRAVNSNEFKETVMKELVKELSILQMTVSEIYYEFDEYPHVKTHVVDKDLSIHDEKATDFIDIYVDNTVITAIVICQRFKIEKDQKIIYILRDYEIKTKIEVIEAPEAE